MATCTVQGADTKGMTPIERLEALALSTSNHYDERDDRVESSHGGTCSSCDAYPVPTKGGLCPSCRLPVETVSDPCGCSGSERSAS